MFLKRYTDSSFQRQVPRIISDSWDLAEYLGEMTSKIYRLATSTSGGAESLKLTTTTFCTFHFPAEGSQTSISFITAPYFLRCLNTVR
jgi:hypothetical protein